MSGDPQAAYDALLAQGSWVIQRVEIDNAADGLCLTVRARATDPAVADTPTLRFTGVVRFEFHQEQDDLPLGLQIVDMADHGWEGVRWKVTDPEYGIASFWCADFSVGTAQRAAAGPT
jgi:hypothetical protein